METLTGTLTLLHPFMPFITEELWQHLTVTQDKSVESQKFKLWKGKGKG